MSIISRYIVRQIARCFFICFTGTLSVYLFVEFFEKTQHFLNHDVKAADLVLYLLLKIPEISLKLVPFTVLMSTIFAMDILNRNNEITAMRSCGISFWRSTLLCVAFALAISLLSLVIDGVVAPFFNHHANTVRAVRIEKKDATPRFKPKEAWIHTGNHTLMNVRSVESGGTILKGVTLYHVDPDFGLLEVTRAEQAYFSNQTWKLQNGITRKVFPDGKVQKFRFQTKPIVLAQTPKDFHIKMSHKLHLLQEMTLRDMKAHADRLRRNGQKFSDFLTDYHARIAFSFASVVFMMIGVPLSLQMRRDRGDGIAVVVGLSLLLIFLYVTIHSLAIVLGRGGVLMPIIAGWFANIMFLFAGWYLFLRVRY